MWGPSSGKLETKNTAFFVLASCRWCVLPNLLVALSRYKLMVFIHETHVKPSRSKVKTKRHLFSFLLLEGRVCYTMC